jgi:hypothetical protein
MIAYRESGFDMSRPPRSSKAISSKRVCKHETHSAFDVGVVFAGVCSRLCATALGLENYNYWSHKDVSSSLESHCRDGGLQGLCSCFVFAWTERWQLRSAAS